MSEGGLQDDRVIRNSEEAYVILSKLDCAHERKEITCAFFGFPNLKDLVREETFHYLITLCGDQKNKDQ